MADEKTALWTPDGIVRGDAKAITRVNLRPGLTEWLCQFEMFARHFQIGMHCARCKADLVGRNGANDKVFSVACDCREFVGQNRDYREKAQPLYDHH